MASKICLTAATWASVAYECFLLPPYSWSNMRPAKTKIVPNHCNALIGCWKIMIDASTVKNLRVVVAIEHTRGPNVEIVRKMKC